MIVWHPYKKIWNEEFLRSLNKVVPNGYGFSQVKKAVIFSDSCFLYLRSSFRHAKTTLKFNKIDYLEDTPINYFDIGLHTEAEELKWLIKNLLNKHPLNYTAYGFEASPSLCGQAREKLKSNSNVHVFNLALCEEIPAGHKIRLYTAGGGLGNSLYKEGDKGYYEEVEAQKFSTFIEEKKIDIQNSINILRMNIEGAELGVLKDLEKNNLLRFFDGFYGMWDDLSKLSSEDYKFATKFLAVNNIAPFTFNGRDMKYAIRKKIILNDIKKSLILGKTKLSKH